MPRAGDLRFRLHFQSRGAGSDGFGTAVTGPFETRFTVSAGMVAKVGGESVMASRLAGTQPYVVTVRQSSQTRQVTTDWRMEDARQPGRIFNIRSIHDPDGRGAWLDMLVTEGVAT
ncbi:head-tail adaptor protein [Pararhodobacter sp.]|uniref:head-tail adaptor protein n=1 Tax=Pararhodobacter sp. TaxID=2127056 RepID=UPI002AFFA311|nr:head-tail adaptor protein [Pararhodobacter sp.]